jgi:hypothetical protein
MFNELYAEYSLPTYQVTKAYSDKDIERAITLH